MSSYIIVGVMFLLFFGVIFLTLRTYIKNRIIIPADEALIIYGRKSKSLDTQSGESRIVNSRVISKGGSAFKMPFLEEIMYVDLKIIQIQLKVEDLPSANFVKVDVDALAIVKVRDDEDAIRTAVTRFGNFRKKENKKNMEDTLYEILQGHLRSTISTLTPEELNSEREKFNQQVQDASGDRLAQLGMQIVDFTIKGVKDKEGYLDKLKEDKVARKYKQIEIEESNALTETKEIVVQNNKRMIEYETEQKVLEEKKRSEAETANIRANEIIERAEKDREIEVKRKEILLIAEENKRKELEYEVEKDKLVIAAKAEAMSSELYAEAILNKAKAESSEIEMKGMADAKSKKALADAFANLDDKAKVLFILEKFPELLEKILKDDRLSKIVGEISKPISSIDSVKVYDFGNNSNGSSPIQKFSELTPSILMNFAARLKDLGFGDLSNKLGLNSSILEDNKNNDETGE